MTKDQTLFESGKFFLGCNWWASHAGTNMWHEWDEDAVREDIKRIKAAGLDVMRVFPLWSDFQPLRLHYSPTPREMRIGEDPLDSTAEGRAGVDPIMIERFQRLCDLAKEHGVKLIVGLITGWMSGRLYAPEALLGLNPITDARAIEWEIRFVKYMVKRFKDDEAIAAWDLGNECNVLACGDIDRHRAYLWLSTITNAIKSEDLSRPVISGMHGTLPDTNAAWNTKDIGEILDVLCTHPYPIFTPHCDTDPINEMKTIMHSTAESLMYAGTSGKPCFIEEIGTLGPMISSDEVAGDYVRAAAFSAWAHDLYGFIWWCANEQSKLTHTPYDWNSVERELGLFYLDGSPKPVALSMGEMSRFADSFKYGKLPERIKDAVCILTIEQDTWAAAYGTAILAKQAGLDLDFAFCLDDIPKAKTYLLPSLSGDKSLPLRKYRELLDRVHDDGATLYISIEDALLSPFSEISGMRVVTRCRRSTPDTVEVDGEKLVFDSSYKLVSESIGADILLKADDGTPALTEYRYGKGRICISFAPIEKRISEKSGLASGEHASAYYKIYKLLGLGSGDKIASSSSPTVCITEHIIDENKRILTVLNYRPTEQKAAITLSSGFRFSESFDVHGKTDVTVTEGGFEATLSKNTGFVVTVERA